MSRRPSRAAATAVASAALAAAIAVVATTSAGAADSSSGLTLSVAKKTSQTVTLGWKPAANAAAYVFSVDGKRVSWTFDPTRTSAVFRRSGELSVRPLASLPAAVWTPGPAAAPAPSSAFDLRLVRDRPQTFTVGWTKRSGVAGYLFLVDGKRISWTFDGAVASATFWKRPGSIEIRPLVALPGGTWRATTRPTKPATKPTTKPDRRANPAKPVTPKKPAPGTGSEAAAWEAVLAALPRPSFTPTRTVTVSDAGSLRAALDGLRAGDLVRPAAPFTVTGPTIFVRAQPTGFAMVDLHGVSIRTGTAGSLEHAVAVVGARNVWITGGDITTRGNTCIWLQDASSFTWRDVDVHDCAGTGIIAQGITRPQTGLDIQARVWNAGTDFARLDPHAEKGTGIHGVYLGGADLPTSGRFTFDVRDQAVGAAVQAGANLVDSDVAIRATRITRVAQSQVAGNALQLWGAVRSVRVRWLSATDVAGRGVETDGLYGSAAGIVVEYARTDGARLAPEYSASPAVTYRDAG